MCRLSKNTAARYTISTMKAVNIAKNTSYFTLALILQKVISFSYFIILARNIGPEDLGKYYFAISFTTIFAIFIDVGITAVLIREIAKARERAEYYVRNTVGLKLALALVSFGVVAILINVMDYPAITRDLVYLSSLAMILDSFTLTFFGIARGFHNLKFESVAVATYQALILALGAAALYSGMGLRWLMAATVMASSLNFLYAAAVVRKKWKLSLWPAFDQEVLRGLLAMSVPFALFGIFQRMYTYFDSILLSVLAGDRYVGLYSVAFKITFALQFLPLAFVASLYPAMSSYFADNPKRLAVTFERAMNYLVVIGLPIAVGIVMLAGQIMVIFKEGYAGSVLPLQIIIASLPFMFAGYPVGSLLNAAHKQTVNSINMAVVLATSIGMNLLLIPRYQAVGASVTVLATNILLLALGLAWVPKIVAAPWRRIVFTTGKSLAAVALMGVLLYYARADIHIAVLIPLAGALYLSVLYLIGGFRAEDVQSITRSFSLKKG